MRDYYIGGTQVAMEAVESMRRQLACELGPHSVRVVTLLRGIPTTGSGKGAMRTSRTSRRCRCWASRTLEDVGNVAAFVASDRARP